MADSRQVPSLALWDEFAGSVDDAIFDCNAAARKAVWELTDASSDHLRVQSAADASLAVNIEFFPGLLRAVALFSPSGVNAMSAVAAAQTVFAERKIGGDQVPTASPPLLPLDTEAEEKRAASVEQQYGKVAPGIVQYTTEVLFHDLWLRPDLAPRDRSLVTVSALIACGQVAQLPHHLNRAMDYGLTQEQTGEAITHLAFYAGWPNAFSALSVAKEIFEKRAK